MLIHTDKKILIEKIQHNVSYPAGMYEMAQRKAVMSFIDMIKRFGPPNHKHGWEFLVLFRIYAIGGKIIVSGKDQQTFLGKTWNVRVLTSSFQGPSVGFYKEIDRAVALLFNGEGAISDG